MADQENENIEEEKQRKVLGLAYEHEHGVPQVILKAAGRSAEDVIWRAQRGGSGPSIVKDSQLLDSLYRLPIDSDVPAELFELIAILLVHVAALDSDIAKVNMAANGGK
jgi:type III secretion system FlhB-like substrate exporter